MNPNSRIDRAIYDQVVTHLDRIEQQHGVVVLHAIESGSRAWGFPSPDSDYDVRFVYAHPCDWYLQLSEERDVIELPISDELDIVGWDIKKALNLANKGNAVIQEWLMSPIIYKQAPSHKQLSTLVSEAFNPVAAYHHYRSMAKKAYFDIENTHQKKLKRFFYFARATLSAKWILDKQTRPSIEFSDLTAALIESSDLLQGFEYLISQKAHESEQSMLEVPAELFDYVTRSYLSLNDAVFSNSKPRAISNDDLRKFLKGVNC